MNNKYLSSIIVGFFIVVALLMGPQLLFAEVEKSPAPKTEPHGEGKRASFSFPDVVRRAQDLSSRPYEEPTSDLPPSLSNLTYDQYRDIRFRPDHSLWRDAKLPFEVQFFLRGFFFSKRVLVNVIDDNGVMLVPFSNDLFHFGKNNITDPLPSDLGFAGIRIHYPLHTDKYYDELAVFLGASYFRALGQHQQYGLSARGLAIDTGLDRPEEFPIFREFWLVKPVPGAKEIMLYALLDTPSCAGAYQMNFKPGAATEVEVKNKIFMRHGVQKMGIAPLTSMFFFGENNEIRTDDFRPEVHDSDGLMMHSGNGEWIWRPLANPHRLRISTFQDVNPKGFGLMQRDRNYDHYQDLEARSERRPSAWIETKGDWGKGWVQLVEIPSDAEKYDNIVAFWIPDVPMQPGQELGFEYSVFFELDDPVRPPSGRTLSTRVGVGGLVESVDARRRKFVVDFGGEELSKLPADTLVEAVVSSSAGKISGVIAQHNPETKGWRVFFELSPEGNGPVELRAYLKANDKALSETWSYQWEKM